MGANTSFGANGLAQVCGAVTVYNFSPDSGLLTGSSREYLAEGVGIPAHSTCEVPPEEIAGKAVIFRENRWLQVDDHRGETVYSTVSGRAVLIEAPGDYPADTTPLKPATAFDVWNGKAWVTDPQAEQKALTAAAESDRATKLSNAVSFTQIWQTQLMLNIISDADKETLTAWMKYIQQLQAVDTALAPAIEWPHEP